MTIELALASPTGTSLPVMAPYLPYEVQAQTLAGNQRGTVIGLETVMGMTNVTFIGLAPQLLADVLPVLRPIEQLNQPTSDGQIPLIAIAKLAVGHHSQRYYQWQEATIEWTPRRFGECAWSLKAFSPSGWAMEMEIDHSWQISVWEDQQGLVPTANIFEIIQYLHEHHFAYQLAPSQYICPETPYVSHSKAEVRDFFARLAALGVEPPQQARLSPSERQAQVKRSTSIRNLAAWYNEGLTDPQSALSEQEFYDQCCAAPAFHAQHAPNLNLAELTREDLAQVPF